MQEAGRIVNIHKVGAVFSLEGLIVLLVEPSSFEGFVSHRQRGSSSAGIKLQEIIILGCCAALEFYAPASVLM